MKSRRLCRRGAGRGAVAKILCFLILLTPWGNHLQSNAADATSHQVCNVDFFLYATNATVVSLVGDFNNWNTTATPMQKTNSEWTVTAQLEPGCHQYKFFIDGRWICDPENPNREGETYGSKNSMILVRPDCTIWKPTANSPRC